MTPREAKQRALARAHGALTRLAPAQSFERELYEEELSSWVSDELVRMSRGVDAERLLELLWSIVGTRSDLPEHLHQRIRSHLSGGER